MGRKHFGVTFLLLATFAINTEPARGDSGFDVLTGIEAKPMSKAELDATTGQHIGWHSIWTGSLNHLAYYHTDAQWYVWLPGQGWRGYWDWYRNSTVGANFGAIPGNQVSVAHAMPLSVDLTPNLQPFGTDQGGGVRTFP